MLKKCLLVVTAIATLGVVMIGADWLAGKAAADGYVPPPSDFPGQTVAFFMWIGTAATPAILTDSIYCPPREVVAGKMHQITLWYRMPSGRIIHGTAQVYKFGGWVGWIALVKGPRIWLKVMNDRVLAMGDGATFAGPFHVKDIEGWGPPCGWFAKQFLILLSLEAGMPPGPLEAGVWPVQERLTCDGTFYEMRTQMNGWKLSEMEWTVIPSASAELEAPAGPAELLPCHTSWTDPDAATMKYCPMIKIGTPCAKDPDSGAK
jgi:hypothetical protein